jgi:hypothetical protein
MSKPRIGDRFRVGGKEFVVADRPSEIVCGISEVSGGFVSLDFSLCDVNVFEKRRGIIEAVKWDSVRVRGFKQEMLVLERDGDRVECGFDWNMGTYHAWFAIEVLERAVDSNHPLSVHRCCITDLVED